MIKTQTDTVKTVLTISMSFLILYMIKGFNWSLYASLGIGLIGVFSMYVSEKIAIIWMKIAWLLSLLVPEILLTFVFYGILFPVAFLSRLFGKNDPLQLKNKNTTMWIDKYKTFDNVDFEKPW